MAQVATMNQAQLQILDMLSVSSHLGPSCVR